MTICSIQRARCCSTLRSCLGGRVAEEMVFDDITTGASEDIKRATATARAMVTKYGMSTKLGAGWPTGRIPTRYSSAEDWGHTKNFSENVAAAIDEEVKEIVESCHSRARDLISGHKYVLEECAKQLITKEKLNRQELRQF